MMGDRWIDCKVAKILLEVEIIERRLEAELPQGRGPEPDDDLRKMCRYVRLLAGELAKTAT
jgi:hypothetical protein